MKPNNIYSSQLSAEDIATLCFSKFRTLPKTGKPNATEWTVLAGIVQHNACNGSSEVISLGCGTKCIGKSRLCAKGLILNDSHAEVLARRSMVRYFYYHMRMALKEGDKENISIFQWKGEGKKFILKEGLSFHFFSTQSPCGDACIISAVEEVEEPLDKRRKVKESECNSHKVEEIYTGAKLLGFHHTDSMEQVLGAVRIKPGKGERTLSMSCSDKMAKWQVMGVQGALLDILIEKPIYLESLNFWGSNELNALQRAIWKRFENSTYENEKYKLQKPKIQICNAPTWEFAQESEKHPSPNGLAWCNIPETLRPYEISVNGKRQGVTRKKLNSPSSALSIARCNLFKEFVDIIKLKPEIFPNCNGIEKESYLYVKMMATEYQNAWKDLKEKYFCQWSAKPKKNLEFSLMEEQTTEDVKKI